MDMKTVVISYLITNVICAGVIGVLYWQNRKNFHGLGFWLAAYVMQFAGLLLIITRGYLPEFISVVAGNGIFIGGTILLYMGLERFLGKRSNQIHNYILLALFVAAHAYFLVIRPSMMARNINLSLALAAMCVQFVWLIFRRADEKLYPVVRNAGFVFAAYGAVSLIRIGVNSVMPPNEDFFQPNLFDTLVILTYQMLFIALTFNLFLMVNRRLMLVLHEDINERQRMNEIIKQSEQLYHQMFIEHSAVKLLIEPTTGAIVQANPAAAKFYGYPAETLEAMNIDQINTLPREDIHEAMANAMQRTRNVFFFQHRLASGKLRDVEVHSAPIKVGGRELLYSIIHDVTERKQAESQREIALEKLQVSEERLRLAVSAGHMGIWDRSFVTGLLNWSVECKTMFGLPPETEMNDELFMNAIHPDDRLPTDIAIREAQAKRTDFNTEYRILWPDGTLHWISALGHWYYNEAGQAIRMAGVTLDITERKRMEEALRISEERYRNFIAQSFEAISRTEFDHPIDTTLPVEEQIDRIYENAFMAECNQAMADMYHAPSPEAFIGMRLIDAHGGKDDPINRQTFRRLIENGYKSVNDETKEYTMDGKPIWFLSNTIGMVENGYLVRLWGTAIDITEQKLTSEALEERTRFTNKLLEATALSTWISDAHGTAIQANTACYQFFGATEAEVIGKYNVFEDNVAEQQGVMPLIRHAYETGEPVTFFLDYDFGAVDLVNAKNATHKFIKVMLTPILDTQGKVSHVVSQSIDLTDIKRTEEALRASEASMRSLIENVKDVFVRYDLDLRYQYVSPMIQRFLEATPESFIGKTNREAGFPEGLAEFFDASLRKAIESKNTVDVEFSLQGRGGEYIMQTRAYPELDEKGEVNSVVTVTRDITEHKRAEEKLREQGVLLSQSQEIAHIGSWKLNLIANHLTWSDEVYRIFGCTPQEFAATYEAFLNFIHPDDRGMVNEAYSHSLQVGADGYEIEHRIVRSDTGEIRYVHERCVHERDDTGAIIQSIGMVQDITKSKQAENELRATHEILQKQFKEINMLKETLQEQAIRDPLTNLHNRRYLDETLGHEVARARRENYPIGIMLIDIDLFKKFNDTYGHSAGDKVLKSLSRLLVDSVRQGDIACRYGGEEFLIIMVGAHEADVERRAEAICRDFSRLRINFEGRELSATVSIGVAYYPRHGVEIQQAIGMADFAMYQAKKAGRNQVHVWGAGG